MKLLHIYAYYLSKTWFFINYSFGILLNLLQCDSFLFFLSTILLRYCWTWMRSIFFSSIGTTSQPEDLNWDCKGWKEEPVMCSRNRVLKPFLVMELITLVYGEGYLLLLVLSRKYGIVHNPLYDVWNCPYFRLWYL